VLSLTALQRRCLHLRADGLCNRDTYALTALPHVRVKIGAPSAKSMLAFPRDSKLSQEIQNNET